MKPTNCINLFDCPTPKKGLTPSKREFGNQLEIAIFYADIP